VFYNRSNKAAAQLEPADFDWEVIFAGGVRWFHSGGIFAALSETNGQLIIEGMKAAKAHSAITSIDLNYRAKLWNLWGGHEVALKVLPGIVENEDAWPRETFNHTGCIWTPDTEHASRVG
jgi:2-dehydro-3-deoxygluconokinase